jgi:hypothetical protein
LVVDAHPAGQCCPVIEQMLNGEHLLSIKYSCPECSAHYPLRDEFPGEHKSCKWCKTSFRVSAATLEARPGSDAIPAHRLTPIHAESAALRMRPSKASRGFSIGLGIMIAFVLVPLAIAIFYTVAAAAHLPR